MKIKTITVSFPHFDDTFITPQERFSAPQVYRVEKVTDSTEFAPSLQLTKAQVDELCAARGWKVTIIPASQGKAP